MTRLSLNQKKDLKEYLQFGIDIKSHQFENFLLKCTKCKTKSKIEEWQRCIVYYEERCSEEIRCSVCKEEYDCILGYDKIINGL